MVYIVLLSLVDIVILFLLIRKLHRKRKEIANNSVRSNIQASKIKTNCDGCCKQNTCKYGYLVYDEIENFRLTLSDKFIFSGGIYCFDDSSFDKKSIASTEELHDMKALKNMDIDKLINTFNYIQERKIAYCNFGKCGRSYFNEMGYNDEKKCVKEAIDSVKNKKERR